MSVLGYFVARREKRWMRPGVDSAGIRFEGAVMSGKKAVEDGLRVAVSDPARPQYGRVAAYDAVLRAHCRLGAGPGTAAGTGAGAVTEDSDGARRATEKASEGGGL